MSALGDPGTELLQAAFHKLPALLPLKIGSL